MSTKRVDVAELLNVKEAAKVIGCSVGRLHQLIREDGVKGVVRFGPRQIVIPRKAVEEIRDNPSSVGRPRKSAVRKTNTAHN